MKKIGIIGAGASGLYASLFLKNSNTDVTILEKNAGIGKKLLMTGNGRCNITNGKFYDDFLNQIIHGQKFMYSSLASHDNFSTMDFFETRGLSLVTEAEDRVFPKSQKSTDVIKFFENQLIDKNIKLITETDVIDIEKNDSFIVHTAGKGYEFDYLLIATGGLSYPNTGSDGAGYKFARDFGIDTTKTYPSLVPIFFDNKDLRDIKALSLDKVAINIKAEGKTYREDGPVLITPTFISGPSVLVLSAYLVDKKIDEITIDFIGLEREDLDKVLLTLIAENPNKAISNLLKDLLNQSLVDVILHRLNIDTDKKANQISKNERLAIVEEIKNFKLNFQRFGGFNSAVITRGGIDLKEINPKTMEAKKVPGLYFIGEVLDIDALTGGCNLQIAWTTAHAAASSIIAEIKEQS